MEPNYRCFGLQRFSSAVFFMYLLHFVLRGYISTFSVYLCLFARFFFFVFFPLAVPSSTPSNTDSVRAEMSHELEKVWILCPTARGSLQRALQGSEPPFPSVLLSYDRSYYRNPNVFIFQHLCGKILEKKHHLAFMLLLAGQNKSCPACLRLCPNPNLRGGHCSTLCSVSVSRSSSGPSLQSLCSYLLQSNILSREPDSQVISEFLGISTNCGLRYH